MNVYSWELRLSMYDFDSDRLSLKLTCILLKQALSNPQSTDSYYYHRGCRGSRLSLDREYCQLTLRPEIHGRDLAKKTVDCI